MKHSHISNVEGRHWVGETLAGVGLHPEYERAEWCSSLASVSSLVASTCVFPHVEIYKWMTLPRSMQLSVEDSAQHKAAHATDQTALRERHCRSSLLARDR